MDSYSPGSLIANRYEVVSRPLLGGMGIVYLCMDRWESQPVALKTFKPEYLPDRDARDRFLREGTAWIELGRHPHIVRCYGVERIGDGTEVYLVLELVAKEQNYPDASLRSWLIPGVPLPIEQVLLFALQIVHAMQHATTVIPGFIHRDLKPENVLVGADRQIGWEINRLRVTDFGLAHILEGSVEQGKGGIYTAKPQGSNSSNNHPASLISRAQLTHGVGTPLYMAPEQWLGKTEGLYTDIYSLGCMLYEMLVGRWIVDGQTITELQTAHCSGKLEPSTKWAFGTNTGITGGLLADRTT